MPTYHIHRMPPAAPPPPNVQGVHYTMLLPDLPPEITTYQEFITWIHDNPSIMGEVVCAITKLETPPA